MQREGAGRVIPVDKATIADDNRACNPVWRDIGKGLIKACAKGRTCAAAIKIGDADFQIFNLA